MIIQNEYLFSYSGFDDLALFSFFLELSLAGETYGTHIETVFHQSHASPLMWLGEIYNNKFIENLVSENEPCLVPRARFFT